MSGKGSFDKSKSWQGDLAFRLWVEEQASVKMVCRACRIHPRSLSKWRAQYGWDEKRKAHSRGFSDVVSAVRGALSSLSLELNSVESEYTGKPEDRHLNPDEQRLTRIGQLSRTMHQLVGTLDQILKVQQDHGPAAFAVKMTEDFMEFLKANSPDTEETVRPWLRKFVQERVIGRADAS